MSQLRNPYDFNEDDLNFKSHGAFSSGPDGIVQKTNDDAAISRLVASRLGYFDDKYVGAFVRKAEPRSPVFNRGTYIRFTAIMNTLRAFIKRYGKEAQIVSLGAGSDTKFFLLKDEGLVCGKYIEIDFAEVTLKKVNSLRLQKSKFTGLHEQSPNLTRQECFTNEYSILACDLRDWDNVVKRIAEVGFKHDSPVLFLSECFLVYLESKYANQIISYAASLPKSYFVTYEQHNPDDAFGKMMLQNLMHRGIKLCGLEDYPQLSLKTDQYSNAGFKSIMAKNLHEISQQLITDTEMERLNGIERLDEVEEWKLLMEHYFILIASCSEEDLGSSVMWKNS